MGYNAFKDVEKRMKYRFWDKERQRSNRAAAKADRVPIGVLCPLRHDTIAWSGPPHDSVLRYVCVHCGSYASEHMIKHMGYDFETVPDYVLHNLMDEMLRQNAAG